MRLVCLRPVVSLLYELRVALGLACSQHRQHTFTSLKFGIWDGDVVEVRRRLSLDVMIPSICESCMSDRCSARFVAFGVRAFVAQVCLTRLLLGLALWEVSVIEVHKRVLWDVLNPAICDSCVSALYLASYEG